MRLLLVRAQLTHRGHEQQVNLLAGGHEGCTTTGAEGIGATVVEGGMVMLSGREVSVLVAFAVLVVVAQIAMVLQNVGQNLRHAYPLVHLRGAEAIDEEREGE